MDHWGVENIVIATLKQSELDLLNSLPGFEVEPLDWYFSQLSPLLFRRLTPLVLLTHVLW